MATKKQLKQQTLKEMEYQKKELNKRLELIPQKLKQVKEEKNYLKESVKKIDIIIKLLKGSEDNERD